MIVTYWGHALGIRIVTEMRRKAFEHLQKLSFGYFDNQKTGHLVARLTKDPARRTNTLRVGARMNLENGFQ